MDPGTSVSSGTSLILVKIEEKIIESTEQDTIHIFRTVHNTTRVFKKKISEQVVATCRIYS